jgi:hypothetical protein
LRWELGTHSVPLEAVDVNESFEDENEGNSRLLLGPEVIVGFELTVETQMVMRMKVMREK